MSDAKFELETWYKVEMELDYNTGTGRYTFKPYTEYNSEDGVYTVGKAIFDFEFDFDTSIAVNQLHFERRGGYEMYLDNVGVSVDAPLSVSDGKIIVNNPATAATLYIAAYDDNGILVSCGIRDIDAGETAEFSISEFAIPAGTSARAYIWDKNNTPLCSAVTI